MGLYIITGKMLQGLHLAKERFPISGCALTGQLGKVLKTQFRPKYLGFLKHISSP